MCYCSDSVTFIMPPVSFLTCQCRVKVEKVFNFFYNNKLRGVKKKYYLGFHSVFVGSLVKKLGFHVIVTIGEKIWRLGVNS